MLNKNLLKSNISYSNSDKYLNIIDEMLSCELFDFSYNTLIGIQDNIKKFNNVTNGQINALKNIYDSIAEKHNLDFEFE